MQLRLKNSTYQKNNKSMTLSIKSNKMTNEKLRPTPRNKNNAIKICLTVFKTKEIKFKEKGIQRMKRIADIQLSLLKNRQDKNNLLNKKKKLRRLKKKSSINLKLNKKKETVRTLNGSNLWMNFIENKLRRRQEYWINQNQIKKNNKNKP